MSDFDERLGEHQAQLGAEERARQAAADLRRQQLAEKITMHRESALALLPSAKDAITALQACRPSVEWTRAEAGLGIISLWHEATHSWWSGAKVNKTPSGWSLEVLWTHFHIPYRGVAHVAPRCSERSQLGVAWAQSYPLWAYTSERSAMSIEDYSREAYFRIADRNEVTAGQVLDVFIARVVGICTKCAEQERGRRRPRR